MSNTKEKAPINWCFTCQLTHIYANFKEQYSEACKVQVNCLKDPESDSYEKKWYERESEWLRLHEAMEEKSKTESYSGQI